MGTFQFGVSASKSNNITTQEGNGLAIYVNQQGQLVAKDYAGNERLVSSFISGGGGGATITSVTYAEATALVNADGLTPYGLYLITDYETIYDQPDYDINGVPKAEVVTKTGPVNPILIQAASVNAFFTWGLQPDYPTDTVKYDFTFSQTEYMGAPAKGMITERIDDKNNRTGYDHRVVLFKRYLDSESGLYDVYVDLGGPSREVLTFSIEDSFDNYIGDNNGYIVDSETFGPFILPNSTISGELTPNSNRFGLTFVNNSFRGCSNNTIGDFCASNTAVNINNNTIGSYFIFNYITSAFSDNFIKNNCTDNLFSNCAESHIGNNFQNNQMLSASNNTFGDFCEGNVFTNEMYDNSFGNYFSDNTFTAEGTQRNTFGNSCQDNNFNAVINDNKFGNEIQNNTFNGVFQFNNCGNGWMQNTLGSASTNEIGNSFGINNISDSFNNNIIGSNFVFNTISDFFSFNVLSKGGSQNDIGSGFANNVIYNDFSQNVIGTGFDGNKIIGDFTNNQSIGNGFTVNIIQGNFNSNIQIGNSFNNNNLGAEFSNNTVGAEFSSNISTGAIIENEFGDNTQFNQFSQQYDQNVSLANFAYNNFFVPVSATNFSSATLVYQSMTCFIILNQPTDRRLYYVDASNVIIFAAIID